MERKRVAEATKGVGRPKVGGPFQLIDQTGKPFTDEDMKGKYSLVYFGFSHCPDICPEELDKMAQMINLVSTSPTRTPNTPLLLPIFITCDPARDTPAVLNEYLSEFHSAIIGLTDAPEDIRILVDEIDGIQLLLSSIEQDWSDNTIPTLSLKRETVSQCLNHRRRGVERLRCVVEGIAADFEDLSRMKKKWSAVKMIQPDLILTRVADFMKTKPIEPTPSTCIAVYDANYPLFASKGFIDNHYISQRSQAKNDEFYKIAKILVSNSDIPEDMLQELSLFEAVTIVPLKYVKALILTAQKRLG
ncbi:hypothetical protein G7Y89_g5344 [Cudoniella acicularis]|uniref:Thioredoxin domain-containing protein n=1 Tax=Cudoniella acicularis TaxID=354080 RepID=A0A8H4RMM8_9HELO|nr:hypothetical protein G7Y89_g5344 [Cudoniella acicularis]